jgi:PAS domain S-box-containing protein
MIDFEKMDSTEALSALFEFATEGILVVNSKGEIIKINPSASKMFGYKKDELLGEQIERIIPDRFVSAHTKHRAEFQQKPHARAMGKNVELVGKRKDQSEFPVEVSLSPYTMGSGVFVIAFVIDITHRKKEEETLKNNALELEQQVEKRTMILQEAIAELEKTKDELKQSLEKAKELSELKSRFVSMASHEFRTPLATMLSSLSLAIKYGEQENYEKQQKHFDRIKSNIHLLTDILNDVLSISKLEEGNSFISLEEFDINTFATEVVHEMQAVAKANQIISYIHHGTETTVNLDKKILRHILLNLISNAIKFSEEGKPIEVITQLSNQNLTLMIKDEGLGISKEDQKHLFQRFFRGQNVVNIQGTGLGLNIVLKYVEMLQGTIQFESHLNQGTTFIIHLPQS